VEDGPATDAQIVAIPSRRPQAMALSDMASAVGTLMILLLFARGHLRL